MKYAPFFLLSLFLLGGCRDKASEPVLYGLPGAWTLSRVMYPFGQEHLFPSDGMTYSRIFDDRDTTFYECRLQSTPSGIVIIPLRKGTFELINKGHGEWLYFEDGSPRPLTKENDTALVIQQNGVLYTWIRNNEMSRNRMEEIRDIISHDISDADGEVMRYVLSVSERELRSTNHRLTFVLAVLAIVVLLTLNYVYRLVRRKKRVERQLRQITEEQTQRPQLVQSALRQVEEDFFASDWFVSFRCRVVAGELLKPEDWEAIEREMKPVYADFFRRLPGLCRMSTVEYRVCLLIKLRFSPSEMAEVLCKDISTISSIRNRLYKKVFGRNGGSRNWDDFILSL
ncbi:MAG: hypothetical protein K2N13_03390 [Paraprevotella sp.]|nr:hypothetical protein [Paraprevotella sp.]